MSSINNWTEADRRSDGQTSWSWNETKKDECWCTVKITNERTNGWMNETSKQINWCRACSRCATPSHHHGVPLEWNGSSIAWLWSATQNSILFFVFFSLLLNIVDHWKISSICFVFNGYLNQSLREWGREQFGLHLMLACFEFMQSPDLYLNYIARKEKENRETIFKCIQHVLNMNRKFFFSHKLMCYASA